MNRIDIESSCDLKNRNWIKSNREVLNNIQPYSASTINTASSYDYLKQFYEKVSDDPGGKNLTFLCKHCPPGLKKQFHTSSTANLKRHIELKHPASLSRYVQVNKNQKTRQQIALTAYSSGSTVFISQPQHYNLVLQYIV